MRNKKQKNKGNNIQETIFNFLERNNIRIQWAKHEANRKKKRIMNLLRLSQ